MQFLARKNVYAIHKTTIIVIQLCAVVELYGTYLVSKVHTIEIASLIYVMVKFGASMIR